MLARFRLLLLLFGFTALTAVAAEERSLGRNLGYLRVHTLPDDLPTDTDPRKTPLVLDLRFVKTNQENAVSFAAWLRSQSRPATPVIVLINSQTAPALLTSLAAKAPPGVVTVGPAANGLRPDVAIEITADADRAAYDALEHGTALDALITQKLDKLRHDEAFAAKERAGNASAEPETSDIDEIPAKDMKAKEGKKTSEAETPPFDAVLQRAVHLHRALLALKKIN